MRIIILSILSIVIIMLIGYLAYYIHSRKYISEKTKIKCLGYIPLNNNSRYLIIQNDLKSNIIEYIKDIRTNLISNPSLKSFAIMSCYSEEGKSWIANNLAVSLARIDKKVLLVDANLRKVSNKSELFYTNKAEGLSDFVRNISLEDTLSNLKMAPTYIEQTQIPNLYVLQNGTITLSSSDLLKSKKMTTLLNLLKEIFDYIIIDGTAFFENDDCLDLSSQVDSNILVTEKKQVNLNHLIHIKKCIEQNNGQILGFILNKTNLKMGKYYGKRKSSKLGVYMESSKVNSTEEAQNFESLIKPVVSKIEKNNLNQFSVLHKELRDNILIEDFINDIEFNFNLKLDNITQNSILNKKHILDLSTKMDESTNILKDEFHATHNKNEEKFSSFEASYKEILELMSNLKNEIATLSSNQEKQNENFKKLETSIQNYDEKLDTLKLQLKNSSIDNNSNGEINKKKSNIINIEKFFMKNRDTVYSIDEPIPYDDLEKLAIEIMDLEPIEEIKKDYM